MSVVAAVGLEAHADQVVGQLLDNVGRVAGDDGLGVVAEEQRLLRLDDDDALLALRPP